MRWTRLAAAAGVTVACGWGQAADAATLVFPATGAEQTYVVPAGVTRLAVVATGAPGLTRQADSPGGLADTVTGTIAVVPGQTLHVRVGTTASSSQEGFNGGAIAGGGGASDIRALAYLSTRLIVAAGAGGGGEAGQIPFANGGLATQTGGGDAGVGARSGYGGYMGAGGTGGRSEDSSRRAGGGGGGLFGGGGGADHTEPPNTPYAGRGGNGSSYLPPGGTRAVAAPGTPPSVRITELAQPAPDRTRPRLSRLSVSPSSFRPGNYGRAVAAKVGGRVAYRVSESATTTFTVQRALSGRRKGRACKRGSRRGRRCTVYRKLRGSFKHADVAGRNSFRFTGRLRGRALKKGRYRLVAVTKDRAGNKAKPGYRAFRIK